MEHYVTLFDGLFLPQGLALHASMERHAGSYTLWILCVDDTAQTVLSQLALPNVQLLVAADCETPELEAVKPTRTRGEYCWTLTPFAPRFVFDADTSVSRVTYVDADLWLSRSPRQLFEEFEASGKAVLITEHAYAPECDRSHLSGRYCVQFMTFVRERGEPVRRWWAERCIEWCFARLEDGKFGDQMYLDDWPVRFGDQVHVLKERALVQGPWNGTRFAPSEAAAYHFHGLRTLRRGRVWLADNYRLTRPALELLYQPYLADLRSAAQQLAAAGHEPRPQVEAGMPTLWWRYAKQRVKALIRGAFPPLVGTL